MKPMPSGAAQYVSVALIQANVAPAPVVQTSQGHATVETPDDGHAKRHDAVAGASGMYRSGCPAVALVALVVLVMLVGLRSRRSA